MHRVSRLLLFDDAFEVLFDVDYDNNYNLAQLAETKGQLKTGAKFSFQLNEETSGCVFPSASVTLCGLFKTNKKKSSCQTNIYMVALLKRLHEVMKSLLGSLTAELVMGNLCLVQEIVDLFMCDGYVQLSSVDKVRAHVCTKLSAPRPSSSTYWTPEYLASSESSLKSLLLSQQKQESYVEELFVDIVEKIEASFTSQNEVTCSVKGYISLNSFFKNSTSSVISLNESAYQTMAGSERKKLIFSDHHFHQSVDCSTFLNSLQFSLSLPSGEVKALTYCVPKVSVPPFIVKPHFSFHDRSLCIQLHLFCQLPPGVMGLGVSVITPVPPNSKTYTKLLKGPNQSATLDLINNVIRWGISQICGGAQFTAKFTVPLTEGLTKEEARLAITRLSLDFELSNYLCSGLRVASVRLVSPPPAGYKKWLRYLSSSSHYTVAVGTECWQGSAPDASVGPGPVEGSNGPGRGGHSSESSGTGSENRGDSSFKPTVGTGSENRGDNSIELTVGIGGEIGGDNSIELTAGVGGKNRGDNSIELTVGVGSKSRGDDSIEPTAGNGGGNKGDNSKEPTVGVEEQEANDSS